MANTRFIRCDEGEQAWHSWTFASTAERERFFYQRDYTPNQAKLLAARNWRDLPEWAQEQWATSHSESDLR